MAVSTDERSFCSNGNSSINAETRLAAMTDCGADPG